jgi:hypothetical protein
MSQEVLLNVVSATSDVTGDAFNSDGSSFNIHIQADSYGTNGKVLLQGKANDTDMDFVTLQDPLSLSGLAEYAANTIVYIDRLTAGMQYRAKLEVSTGTVTNLRVVKN